MSSAGAFLAAGFDAQGLNFAAVFQGLDAHRLRIVPTAQSSSNGPISQEFVLNKSTRISALAWAHMPHGDKSQQMKKRKKTSSAPVESADVVVLGTTLGTLLLYSPATNTISTTLKTGSSSPICSIKTSEGSDKLLSLQNDGTLTEFDLSRNALVVSSVVSVPDPSALLANPELVVANTAPHLCRSGTRDIDVTYTGFATPVRQLLPLGASHFAAISEDDRQILVYRIDTPKPVHSLMCPATNASHISCSKDLTALAVSTEDGQVHVFENPTKPPVSTTNSKAKRNKSVPQSTPKFSIEVSLAKRGSSLRVTQTRFSDDQLMLVWTEQGSVPIFDIVPWTHKNGEMVTENYKLEKQPSAPLAKEHLIGGLDPASAPVYQEANTKVVSGDHVDDLSDEEDDGETLADRLEALEVELDKRDTDGEQRFKNDTAIARDEDSSDAEDNDESSDEENNASNAGQSSLKSNGKSPKASGEQKRQSRLRRKELKLSLSQPGSFATLLNQALTLKDKQLLEICLEERDAAMIKTSIVKLEPALAATLLDHLASTIARAQNRSVTLTQWIRWVVVIHGAYLVTLPNLLKNLAALHSTLSAKASTLPRLLSLQGRLELLKEQLSVREEIAAVAAEDDEDVPEAYYDEEEALIVNGEEANDDLSETEMRFDQGDSFGDSNSADDAALMLSDSN